MKEPLWDVNDVSRNLRIARPTIYAWIRQKRIPHLKIGDRVLFRAEEIEGWLHTFARSTQIDGLASDASEIGP